MPSTFAGSFQYEAVALHLHHLLTLLRVHVGPPRLVVGFDEEMEGANSFRVLFRQATKRSNFILTFLRSVSRSSASSQVSTSPPGCLVAQHSDEREEVRSKRPLQRILRQVRLERGRPDLLDLTLLSREASQRVQNFYKLEVCKGNSSRGRLKKADVVCDDGQKRVYRGGTDSYEVLTETRETSRETYLSDVI